MADRELEHQPFDAVASAARLLSRCLIATHAERISSYDAAVFDGALLIESDRMLLYIAMRGQWLFIAGQMAVSGADVPLDLAPTDVGVAVQLLDCDCTLYWAGDGWVFTSKEIA